MPDIAIETRFPVGSRVEASDKLCRLLPGYRFRRATVTGYDRPKLTVAVQWDHLKEKQTIAPNYLVRVSMKQGRVGC